MTIKKKILMLVHEPQTRPGHLNWVALRDLVREHMPDDTAVEMSAISELTFVIDGQSARVYDTEQGYDLADFDLVVFRTMYGQPEACIAIAAYCRKKGIPYIDQYIPEVGNTKFSCAFIRWEHNLPVPPTAYGPAAQVASLAASGAFGWPVVVKADRGKKGQDNFLAHTPEEVQRILTEHEGKRFVMQAFIPNKGDYRILVFNGKPKMAMLRQASGDSHLNNTSQGGSATLVPLEELAPEIIDIAITASSLERLAIAGVDIIIDAKTSRSYILEVNRAPQVATGGFADQKIQLYSQALQELVNSEGERT
jgi:glutathione synthase/RimK-type ligase-like ATP-grasp enzyme